MIYRAIFTSTGYHHIDEFLHIFDGNTIRFSPDYFTRHYTIEVNNPTQEQIARFQHELAEMPFARAEIIEQHIEE